MVTHASLGCQVKSSQVKPSQVKSSEAKSSQVKSFLFPCPPALPSKFHHNLHKLHK